MKCVDWADGDGSVTRNGMLDPGLGYLESSLEISPWPSSAYRPGRKGVA